MWCIQAHVLHFLPLFFLFCLIHFSKCLPRRLNKRLGRWGKVNLGQTASCWTEGRVECAKVNCGLLSLTAFSISCFFKVLTRSLALSLCVGGSPCAQTSAEYATFRRSFNQCRVLSQQGAEMVRSVLSELSPWTEGSWDRQGEAYWSQGSKVSNTLTDLQASQAGDTDLV